MQSKFFFGVAIVLSLSSSVRSQSIDWHNAETVARTALEGHPTVASLEARVEAASQRARSAGAYPNPMLMGGVQDQQIDLSRDEMMTMYMVGASQTIPRKERRQLLRRSAQLDVERLRHEVQSLKEELRRDALFAYYDVAAADSQITATEQLSSAIDAIADAARFRYEAGTTLQADVIRAQLQRSGIDHQLLALKGRRRAAASQLLARIGLPVTTEIPRLQLAHATEARSIASALTVPDDHPALAAIKSDIEASAQSIQLARLIEKPDWNLEASYGMRPEEKDVFSVTARVELPLRRKSVIAPQIRAAIAEREAASQRVEELRRQLLADLGVAWERHATATMQLQLHEEVLVPQTRLVFDSTLAAYQSGKDNFESVLNAEADWLRLHVDYYDFLLEHIKAITDFEAIRRGARSGATGAMTAIATSSPGGSTKPGMSAMR